MVSERQHSCFSGAFNLCASIASFDPLTLDGCLRSTVQPNKVYIGGLPEHTRQEDLQSCFGKIGSIVNIELKYVIVFKYYRINLDLCFRVGYGFVVG